MKSRLNLIVLLVGVGALCLLLACRVGNVDPDLPTLKQSLEAKADLTQYIAASKAAGRYDELDGSLYYTVFAPTNAAWDSFLVQNNYDSFSEVPDTTLSRIIWYQRQLGKVFQNDLFSGYVTTPAPSWNGLPIALLFLVQGSGVTLNNQSKLISVDQEAADGVIHVSDAVLIPPNLIEAMELNGDFSLMLAAIEKAGMTEELKTRGNITLFAPPDEVFEDFLQTEVGVNDLDDYSAAELNKIIRYHILDGTYTAAELRNLTGPEPFETLLNNKDMFISANTSFVVLDDSINIVLLDIHAMNGTIHLVDDVLEFE